MQPLSKAQVRFQKLKRQERQNHKENVRQSLREDFMVRRKNIEESIADGLEMRGLEVNMTAVRHLAFEQAKSQKGY